MGGTSSAFKGKADEECTESDASELAGQTRRKWSQLDLLHSTRHTLHSCGRGTLPCFLRCATAFFRVIQFCVRLTQDVCKQRPAWRGHGSQRRKVKHRSDCYHFVALRGTSIFRTAVLSASTEPTALFTCEQRISHVQKEKGDARALVGLEII